MPQSLQRAMVLGVFPPEGKRQQEADPNSSSASQLLAMSQGERNWSGGIGKYL